MNLCCGGLGEWGIKWEGLIWEGVEVLFWCCLSIFWWFIKLGVFDEDIFWFCLFIVYYLCVVFYFWVDVIVIIFSVI